MAETRPVPATGGNGETALTTYEAPRGALVEGGLALGAMSDAEFEAQLERLRRGQERIKALQRAIMVDGTDYGTIPGTDKPTLLKPGAEKIALAYGLVARIEVHTVAGDGVTAPPLRVDAQAILHHGSWDGPVVAIGHGTASTWESRYRWRRGSKMCPECGRAGVIYVQKGQSRYWHPPDAKPDGGCNGNFAKDDSRLREQVVRRIENDDPYDQANTVVKIASKRAFVDGVLRATATSGLFTQDVEDAPPARGSAADAEEADWRDAAAPGASQAPVEAPEPTTPDGRTRADLDALRKFGEWVRQDGFTADEVVAAVARLFPDADPRKLRAPQYDQLIAALHDDREDRERREVDEALAGLDAPQAAPA